MSTEAVSPAPAAASTSNFPRPPRGAGTGTGRFNSSRGPRRGGFSGPRGASSATSKFPPSESTDWATAQDDTTDSSEEVAQLKIKYAGQLKVLKDVFPDWTAEDLVFALQEVDGDVDLATDRIATGKHLFVERGDVDW
jgi:CUE domain